MRIFPEKKMPRSLVARITPDHKNIHPCQQFLFKLNLVALTLTCASYLSLPFVGGGGGIWTQAKLSTFPLEFLYETFTITVYIQENYNPAPKSQKNLKGQNEDFHFAKKVTWQSLKNPIPKEFFHWNFGQSTCSRTWIHLQCWNKIWKKKIVFKKAAKKVFVTSPQNANLS